MRKILFKAKRTDNGEWVEGYLWRGNNHSYIIPSHVGIGYDDKKTNLTATAYEIDPATICQYTGMNDKNGVRIWEHDNCLITRPCTCAGAHIVYKDACFFGYDKLFKSMIKLCDLKLNGYEIEVVSNNPEPMEVSP